MQTVALFDGTGLLVRCCKVGAASPLRAGGVPTGPLYFFLNSLSRRLREFSPSHVAVAWDGFHGRRDRTEIFPGYKAGREPFSGGRQFDLAREACSAAGIFQHSSDSFEADDVIATIWRRVRREMPGARVFVFTDDHDLHQLVDGSTTVISSWNDGSAWDLEKVRSHYGCEPPQVPVLRALSGDKSDGIPGVPGIGPKKAWKLLGEADWRISNLPLGLEARGNAAIYYSVMNLDFWNADGLPEDIDDALKWDPAADRPELGDFLRRFEMASLLARMDEGRLWRKYA
jgi:DNA polymerase-1